VAHLKWTPGDTGASGPILPPVDPEKNYPLPEAAAYLGVSIRSLHRLGDTGQIRMVRILRRKLVPGREVIRVRDEGTE
jgi:hypothetical protein